MLFVAQRKCAPRTRIVVRRKPVAKIVECRKRGRIKFGRVAHLRRVAFFSALRHNGNRQSAGSVAKKATLAKLTRPKLHNVLARGRLFALLDQCLLRAVTWIRGPPGAGKTALAASYIDANKLKGV